MPRLRSEPGNPYISSQFGYEQGFDTFHDFLDDEPAPLEEKVNAAAPARLGKPPEPEAAGGSPRLGPLGIVYDELYFRYCQRVTPVANSLDALRRFPAADVIVDHARTWLASIGDPPFFLWLHLMDPHSPYYPKDEALALMGHGSVTPSRARYLNSYWNRSDLGPARLARHRDEVVALYDAGIRWVDVQMARLIETLRGSKRWDDCIFALTADHGEEFLDHGGRYHPPSQLMEELIHVPLLLRVPGSAKKEVAKSPFSLLHLAPTLLDAAQLPAERGFQGRSYWDNVRQGTNFDGAAISECVAGCTNPFRRGGSSRFASVVGPRIALQAYAAFRSSGGASLRSGGGSRRARAAGPNGAEGREATLARNCARASDAIFPAARPAHEDCVRACATFS